MLPITERHRDYAREGRRRAAATPACAPSSTTRNEKLDFKIREAELQKIPLMLVVGDQEVANGTVTPRRRHGPNGAPGRWPWTRSSPELSARSGRAARVDLVPS